MSKSSMNQEVRGKDTKNVEDIKVKVIKIKDIRDKRSLLVHKVNLKGKKTLH